MSKSKSSKTVRKFSYAARALAVWPCARDNPALDLPACVDGVFVALFSSRLPSVKTNSALLPQRLLELLPSYAQTESNTVSTDGEALDRFATEPTTPAFWYFGKL
jgi:hypothetical protein